MAEPAHHVVSIQDYGHPLDYSVVTKGIRELSPDVHFDMGGALGQWHPMIESRAGVYYLGRHICSIDRGMIPEYKVWIAKDGMEEVPVSEAQKLGLPIQWQEVLPADPFYEMGMEKARNHDDRWIWDEGKQRLTRLIAYRMTKIRDRVIRVGWRHTFERLIAAGIPGITRDALAKKFAVDMLKFPMGSPEEVHDAIYAE